jgi:tetratricopeptide (TPR) repeat protein
MKALLVCSSILCLAIHAQCCANYSGAGTSFNGAWVHAASPYRVIELKRALNRNLPVDGIKLEADLRSATNFNDRSDYSIALMYLGRSQEAIDLLQKLEKEEPGHYFIAANLGTAFELAGNNEEALHWIAEGIQRNPKSHEGTEWLHLRILEAKIAQQKDPDYFKSHSVLDLDPRDINEDTPIGKDKLPPAEIAAAIQHQLTERLQFVKPPDPAVAGLLFDYAAIEAGTRTLESAKQILQMAESFGYPPEKIEPLVKLYDQRITWRKTKQYSFYSFLAMAGIGLLYVLYRKKIFVLSSRDPLSSAF